MLSGGHWNWRFALLAAAMVALALGLLTMRLRAIASQRETVEAVSKYGQFRNGRNHGLTRFFFGEFPWTDRVVLKIYVPVQVDRKVPGVEQTPTHSVEYLEVVPPDSLIVLLKRLPRLDELSLPGETPPETVAAICAALPKCNVKRRGESANTPQPQSGSPRDDAGRGRMAI